MTSFQDFGKIPRLFRECVITEKIDGTNGQVHIEEIAVAEADPELQKVPWIVLPQSGLVIAAGSRSRYLSYSDDNFGFYKWVEQNADELIKLGPGRHYGEWWGQGIQRRYGINEKRFSLFNVERWKNEEDRPKCCHVVPVLYRGPFQTFAVRAELDMLQRDGSRAAPGFMKPEGIMVYHTAARQLFKATIENDDEPKGKK